MDPHTDSEDIPTKVEDPKKHLDLSADDDDVDDDDEDLDGTADSAVTDEKPKAAKVHNYIVSTRTDREIIHGRQAAVNQAKEMTVDGASVQVEREDGRVRMQFRDGSLVEYVYETRKGRTI